MEIWLNCDLKTQWNKRLHFQANCHRNNILYSGLLFSLFFPYRILDTQGDRNFLRIWKLTSAQWRWWFLTDRSLSEWNWQAVASLTISSWPGNSSLCTNCVRSSSLNRWLSLVTMYYSVYLIHIPIFQSVLPCSL